MSTPSSGKRSLQRKKRSRAEIVWKRWADWRKLLVAVSTGAFISLLLIFQFLPDKVSVQIGQDAPQDILAPRFTRYQDRLRTEWFRNLAANQVPKVYSSVLYADGEARDATSGFFNEASRLRQSKETLARRIETLRARASSLNAEDLRVSLTLTPDQLRQAREAADRLSQDAMSSQILPEQLDQKRAEVRGRASSLPDPPPVRRVAGAVAAASLVPNRYFNQRETEEARQRERDQVSPYWETIQRGDLVIRKGERVTPEHMVKLSQLGLVQERLQLVTAVSLVLLSFGLVAVFCLYLYQFHPRILRDFSSLLLVALVACGCLLLFRGGSTAVGLRFTGDQLGFLGMISSALGAMLIAALLCPQVAVFVGISLALLTSVMVGSDLKFAVLSIVSSLVGVQCVSTIRNRAGILRAALVLAAVNVVAALVAHGATQNEMPEQPGQMALWAGAGGLGSVMLFYFLAAWLERPFRVTTPLTLLELSDPSHPLLRRLAMEAPGTYHHSLIVGNLAEAASEAIGADPLFSRVASYYHDVGKVVRPHFFVENQSAHNRHDEINPSLSSLIIASHVKDGVELAEEHRLPPPIISIIREHHGTCLIKYFYHRAVTSGGGENSPALEYQFRYDGPRPQTKESGIIMIADSVEAASRTLEKATPGRIRDLIEHIVKDRLSDGQLDECELTFKDLEKIITSMTRTLSGMLHARIEYPAGDTARLRKLAADGTAHQEPVASPEAFSDTPEAAGTASRRGAGL